ncbi:OmpA family protein [Alginatibacterium sediminis]|uniref:OmpA family protein n=1 Tax=Alginatibacterium sediminis TaxID=2164068 RepID=A0A420EGP5_9ALTE|nr:OmpA family protein [Alginatibacterium sediminis]RKF19726.1 OmpA family protein [Alginatibacterium sediminis]
MKKILIVSACVVALSGCQTTRPNATTGEMETSNTTTGALLGCAGGAIIGAIANNGKGAAIGCAAGGVTGGVIGAQMDKTEAALRQELVNSGVQVKRNGDQIQLIMANAIAFETGKVDLSQSIKPSLNSVIKVMARYPDTNLLIEGHTDSVGSESSNQVLSERRAYAVSNYLNANGFDANRSRAVGFGELSPMCGNDSEQGKACNRRVELKITPKT